jgi:hypothetical protein
MKRIVLVVMIGLASIGAWAYSGGNGTEQSPYLISSKADMEQLASSVNSGQRYSGIYFRLTRDLTGPEDVVTTVIGGSVAFSGIFDGDDHEIAVNRTGIFGSIQNAVILNLGVVGTITSSTGGICGSAGSSKIINCRNKANISSSSSVGGICGGGGTISYCYNTGTISSSSYTSYAGGICGGDGRVKNCFAANSQISNGTDATRSRIGRIMGAITSTSYYPTNCHAIGNMLINGDLISSQDANGKDGKDALLSDFRNRAWLEATLEWDFENVWEMSDLSDPVNKGFPILVKYLHQEDYTITASAGSRGKISPSGSVLVNRGKNKTFKITPEEGYEINQVLVDDANNASAVAAGSYMFSNVTANHSISATFKQKQYTITVSVDANGTISPSSDQTVLHGGSSSFTFWAKNGYELDQVLIDGVNNPTAVSSGSYSFTNIIANHSIAVRCKQKQPTTYIITASAGGGGNISPSGSVSVNVGSSQTFTFTPLSNYEINQVLVDGVNNASAVAAGYYTFSNVMASHSISVSFKQKPPTIYTITASAGSGGNISPSGSVSVTAGGSQTFTFTPLSNYEINQVLVDGVNNVIAVYSGSYSFSNVTANHSISVSFKQKQPTTYTITASAGSGGNISPSGNVSVSAGGSQTFTFTPLSNYEINQVLVDGVNNASAVSTKSYTFSNVTANHSISVSFKQKQDFSGGSGAQQNPYLISSRADMEQLASNVNGGQSYSGMYFRLTRDLTGVNDVVTTVVGNVVTTVIDNVTHIESHAFSGIFDGGGYTLKVNISTEERYAGVFGIAYGATIRNLGVVGVVTGGTYVGGICGDGAFNTVISNCHNIGEVSSTSSSSSVGGICGDADGFITDCYNAGKVSSSSSSSVSSSSSRVGGICGYGAGVDITNCYNTGEISSFSSSTTAYAISRAGGICGYGGSSTISDCYNTGAISSSYSSSSPDANSDSGGICGYGEANITNCYNTGEISSYSHSGGICGRALSSGGSSIISSSITNCYNAGKVFSSPPTSATRAMWSTAGGIGGYFGGVITNCYNIGEVSSYSNSGGINGCGGGTISNCYNMAAISTSSLSSDYSTPYSGGISGFSSEIIQNCFVVDSQIKAVDSYRISVSGIYNCYADKNITLNGSTVSSNDANSKDGKDATLANFQTQSWIQANLPWNFQTVWEMSTVNDPVHKGLPILKGMDNVVGIPAIRPEASVVVDVYPNPAKDELFFTSDTPIRRVEIGQLSGARVVVKENVGQGIHISHLPNGTYLVRIYTDAGAVTKKIIKN